MSASGPGWFDWTTLVVTVLAAAVPAIIAIVLWRSDRRASAKDRRELAAREFTLRLETGDGTLLRFRDVNHFATSMGTGAAPLVALIRTYLAWSDDEDDAPRIDLAVDANDAISRWMWKTESDYRADLTEVFLANGGDVYPAAEDNRIISPTTRRQAERAILKDRRTYGEWLAGSRLAPARIRWRRVLRWLDVRVPPSSEPLNPLATNTYLDDDQVGDDPWLRERTAETLENPDEPTCKCLAVDSDGVVTVERPRY